MYLPEKKAEKILRKYGLPEPGEKIVIGLSGGADSVALFRVMLSLARKYAWELIVVHVEHGIRGSAALADAEWVQKLSEKYQVPFLVFHEDIPGFAVKYHLTEEEAGRIIRYQRFHEVMMKENAGKIAVAHNANDNAETMLLSLVRGTGLDGLRGIPAVRDNIIRPLIEVPRNEIEAYLREIGQDWREDATNAKDAYARNRIRNRVLPELQIVNNQAVSHMNQTAEFVSEAAAFIEAQTKKLFQETEIDTENLPEYLDAEGVTVAGALDVSLAKEPSSFLRREVLHLWISGTEAHGKDITSAHIYALEDLLLGQAGRKVDLPYGLTAVKGYRTLQLLREEAGKLSEAAGSSEDQQQIIPRNLPVGFCGELSLGNHHFTYCIRTCTGEGDRSQNIYTKTFDYDKIKCNVRLRYRMPGDRIIVNSRGAHQSLKKYFINAKVPRGLRDGIPVFACEEEVLMIAGYRGSSGFLVDGDTRVILEIQEKCHE